MTAQVIVRMTEAGKFFLFFSGDKEEKLELYTNILFLKTSYQKHMINGCVFTSVLYSL